MLRSVHAQQPADIGVLEVDVGGRDDARLLESAPVHGQLSGEVRDFVGEPAQRLVGEEEPEGRGDVRADLQRLVRGETDVQHRVRTRIRAGTWEQLQIPVTQREVHLELVECGHGPGVDGGRDALAHRDLLERDVACLQIRGL